MIRALVLTVCLLLAPAAPAATGRPVAPASAIPGPISRAGPATVVPARVLVQRSLEDRVLELTNERRLAHGCRALERSAKLRRAARRHTVAMARAGVMSHRLPGEPRFATRITRSGYRGWRLVAENIARGFASAESVLAAWLASPGHRRNLLDCRLRDLGVGVVLYDDQLWWTQNFGVR